MSRLLFRGTCPGKSVPHEEGMLRNDRGRLADTMVVVETQGGGFSVLAEGPVACDKHSHGALGSVGPGTCGPGDAIRGTILPGSWRQKTSQRENLLLILRNKEPGSNDLWDQLTGPVCGPVRSSPTANDVIALGCVRTM